MCSCHLSQAPTGLAAGVTSGSPVTVSAVDNGVYLESKATGSGTGYSYSLETTSYNTTDFSQPSFVNPPVTGTLDDGQSATSGEAQQVYGYAASYDAVGNVLSYADTVMGAWSFGYDNLDRLSSAQNTGNGISTQFANMYGCWTYDSFGNRTKEAFSTATTTPCASGANDNAQLTVSTPTAQNQVSGLYYDAAGDVTNDGRNQYLYDPEGRICAVSSTVSGLTTMTGYLYDAEGNRVAKGIIQNMNSCDPAVNGFQPSSDFVVGPSGEQMAEAAVATSGEVTPAHSNVWEDGTLLATYDLVNGGVHFVLADPLGTKRVQMSGMGVAELDCLSLPFGNNLGNTYTTDCQPPPGASGAPDATEHHFAGKERDTESGNDYFGARYYASSMGRMMSPDPLPWIEWQHGNEDDQKRFDAYIANPQNFNMYAYVLNNPLNKTDPTGMNACGTNNDSSCKVTVTIQDRSRDANGNYNDKYAGLKGNGSYNAIATVSVNGKVTGTFLADTTSSGGKFATIQNGTYDGVLHNHHGDPNKPSIELMVGGSNHIPTIAPNPAQGGASFATDVLIHPAGGTRSNPLGYTGLLPNGHGVSEACQLICSVQYQQFLGATGIRPSDGSAPQRHFSVILDTSENQ